MSSGGKLGRFDQAKRTSSILAIKAIPVFETVTGWVFEPGDTFVLAGSPALVRRDTWVVHLPRSALT